MPNLTFGRSRIGVSLAPSDSDLGQQGDWVSVAVRPRSKEVYAEVWEQFKDGLRDSLERSGFRQPDAVIEEKPPPPSWASVAPGVIVRASEYEERYGGLDLQGLRKRMAPAVFKAFVRHIGTVPGRPDLDVDEISTIPEVR